MSHPLLEINDLSVSFTQYERGLRRRVITPVQSMTLSARAGEITALVGASGSGKTLLGLAVLGLLPPNASTAGSISYDSAPLTPARRREVVGREISMLPQAVSHLDPTATVGAQIGRALELAGRSRTEVDASLAERGLGPQVARQYPHQLSGGMARRVLLAMAMAGQRRLLIADEPTPGLDAASAEQTLTTLRRAADAGAAVVLVSHDLAGVMQIADHVVVTDHGRTLETATPDQFADRGAGLVHEYSRALWRALPANGFHLPERASSHEAANAVGAGAAA